MDNLNSGNLSINVEDQGGKTTIHWLGKSDERDPSATLNPYLNGIIQEVAGKEISVDFQKL